MDPFEHEAHLEAEITSLDRWLEELRTFVEKGLDDPEVSMEAFTEADARMARIYPRLKALYDRQWERLRQEFWARRSFENGAEVRRVLLNLMTGDSTRTASYAHPVSCRIVLARRRRLELVRQCTTARGAYSWVAGNRGEARP